MMKPSSLVVALLSLACLPVLAEQQLTVVNFGGANANAQKKAFYEPYEKTGTKVVAVEYNGEQAITGTSSRTTTAVGTICRGNRCSAYSVSSAVSTVRPGTGST